MTLDRLAWLAQVGTTLPMVGLIWFVQVVAYPQFARVGPGEFAGYHQAHARLITFVVGPLMGVELLAAATWVVVPGALASRAEAWAGLGLVGLAWAVTGLVSVPRHEALGRGFDARAHAVLVATNWLRTAAWTARGALLLVLLARRG